MERSRSLTLHSRTCMTRTHWHPPSKDGWRISDDSAEFAPAPGFPETRKTLASYHAALFKGASEESRLPFLHRSRTGQRVGSHHQFASAGANAWRPADSPGISKGWLVHGKSRQGRFHSAVGRQDLLESFSSLDRKSRWWPRLISARPGPMVMAGMDGNPLYRGRRPRAIPPTILREHSARLSHAASKRLPSRARSGRNSSSARACRRAGQNLVPRWSMGFNSGWIHFGVPGTEHIKGPTSLTSVIAKLVANGSQEA